MRARLYIAANEVALDFETEADRDLFHKNLAENASGGFSPQDAAVKVGDKTIRFHPDGFKVGYQWAVEFVPTTAAACAIDPAKQGGDRTVKATVQTQWLCLDCTKSFGQTYQWSNEFLAGIGSTCRNCGKVTRVQRINRVMLVK